MGESALQRAETVCGLATRGGSPCLAVRLARMLIGCALVRDPQRSKPTQETYRLKYF